MATINLRQYYPSIRDDALVDVSDDLVEQLRQWERNENAYTRQKYRYRAYFSLDRDDGIEHEVLFAEASPEEQYFHRLTYEKLHAAISLLPDKQGKRIYAYFFLGLTQTEIARAEGVSIGVVSQSIHKGLYNLKLLFSSLE